MNQDIWSILQIEPTNSKREIRRAYAIQAQKCHPEEQPEEFAKLQEAYQCALNSLEHNNGNMLFSARAFDENQEVKNQEIQNQEIENQKIENHEINKFETKK